MFLGCLSLLGLAPGAKLPQPIASMSGFRPGSAACGGPCSLDASFAEAFSLFRVSLHGLAVLAFRAAKTDTHSIFDYAEAFASVARAVAIREMMYDILWDVACADGTVSVEERRVLEVIVTPLRIRPSLFSEQRARRMRTSQASKRAADPYSVLGCSASDTNEEVRRAYRARAKKHHPDLLRAQGLPEEMVARANEQMARINAAWDEIMRVRGLG